MRRAVPILALICLSLPALACESSPAGARQQHIDSARDTFVFRAPAQRLYDQARALLGERGHALPAGPAPVDTTIESPWVGPAHHQKRFLVRIIRVDDGRHLVHLIGQSRGEDGTVFFSERWRELEWELIQRVEPARAVDIARAANKKADDVHKRNNRRSRRGPR
jgi:hypothetical protein